MGLYAAWEERLAEEEESSEAWPLVSPPPLAMGGGEARSSLNGESRDSAPEPAAESGEGEGEAGILGAELQTKVPEYFTITEKAPARDYTWLKVPTRAFTFETL